MDGLHTHKHTGSINGLSVLSKNSKQTQKGHEVERGICWRPWEVLKGQNGKGSIYCLFHSMKFSKTEKVLKQKNTEILGSFSLNKNKLPNSIH